MELGHLLTRSGLTYPEVSSKVYHDFFCPLGSRVSLSWAIYVGYSESKYSLRISSAHPRDCHFAHVQWIPLSIEKPQTPFREIRIMFMFIPVH